MRHFYKAFYFYLGFWLVDQNIEANKKKKEEEEEGEEKEGEREGEEISIYSLNIKPFFKNIIVGLNKELYPSLEFMIS